MNHPPTAMRLGRSPNHTKAMIAIQIGDSESSSELMPVGRNWTVQAVMPLPSSSSVAPVTVARTRSSRVTRPRPVATHSA